MAQVLSLRNTRMTDAHRHAGEACGRDVALDMATGALLYFPLGLLKKAHAVPLRWCATQA
jgi:hypothetical protein